MNNISSKPVSITRTWSATITYREVGVVVAISKHVISLTADAQGVITATVDGAAADVHTADNLLRWSRAENGLTLLSEVRGTVEGISKGEACNLHRVLGGFGFKGHYALASELVGRELSSLTQLSSDEAAMVRSWAHGQMGLVG